MRFPSPHDVELHPPDTGESKLITPVTEDRLSATDDPERAQVAFKRDSHQMVSIPATPVSMHSGRDLNRLQVCGVCGLSPFVQSREAIVACFLIALAAPHISARGESCSPKQEIAAEQPVTPPPALATLHAGALPNHEVRLGHRDLPP